VRAMAAGASAVRRAGVCARVRACAAGAARANPPAPAWACSCAFVKPEAALAAADAAFVGTLETRRESNPGPVRTSLDPVTLGFRVEEVLKGDLGSRVEVVTAASGASCGIEARRGQRLALVLHRVRGRWQSGLCDQLARNLHTFTIDDHDRGRRWLLLAATASAIVAAAGAALVLRRRRRPAS
jgi:hypothetical protein